MARWFRRAAAGGDERNDSEHASESQRHGRCDEPAPRRWLRRRSAVYTLILLVLVVLERLLSLAAPGSSGHGVATALLVIWALVGAVLLTRWLWRRLTYRVGARLFWSYLLIGLVPFSLLGLLGTAALYMFVGQYASVRLGATLAQCEQALTEVGMEAAARLERGEFAAAVEVLRSAESTPPAPLPRFEWAVLDGPAQAHSGGVEGLATPVWTEEGDWVGAVRAGETVYAVSMRRRGQRVIASLLPLDLGVARSLSANTWFDVRFAEGLVTTDDGSNGGGFTLDLDERETRSGAAGAEQGGSGLRLGGERVDPDQVEPGWSGRTEPGAGLLGKPWIVWFRVGPPLRSWSDGSEIAGRRSTALLRTSVAAAWRDFTSSRYAAGGNFMPALKVLGAVCAVLYGLAVLLAAVQIFTITRSTARLTRGAREVGRGQLDYRIKVKRRDQLGDLAVSFNQMTESVKGMLVEVAEKERLAHELELAREIQEGLLPASVLHYGEVGVFAHFRPAAEIGGDYFDVIPVESGRVIVAVGDIAGHGVSTGLLMAMVKSAVAALVHEGRRGVDLLERLNHLVLENPRRHRTATFLLVEVDTKNGEGRAGLASAGHPPAFAIDQDGRVTEVLTSSLPLGHLWPEPPAGVALPFRPGSRLLLYSDGLVEAVSPDGVAFGYDGLQASLIRHRGRSSAELLGAVLADLDRHVGAAPLGDDLTVLVVERGVSPSGPATSAAPAR